MERGDSGRLLVWAGFAIWVVAGLPQTAAWVSGRTLFDGRSLVWCAAYGAFAIAFLLASATERLTPRRPTMLAVQSGAALVVIALGVTGFEGALLCVVAGEAPLLVGERTGLAWVVGQTAAMAAVDLVSPFHTRGHGLSAAAYAGFQLFAFGASRLAARDARGRKEIARVHAELLATQELLADSTRAAERLRIARELHDALGHHLTALSLQLELARNLVRNHPDPRLEQPVAQAHALTRELLAELRSVVSTMREDSPLDLSRALRTLVTGVLHPRVHLDIQDDLRLEAALAHTIFRCVQEALTNAIRHAGAQNVYLAVATEGETVTVTAKDDGRGVAEAARLHVGHGLSGLRERIEGMGGSVEIEAQPGAGLTLRALLPARARLP
jgi:signal transduction histidine kinase